MTTLAPALPPAGPPAQAGLYVAPRRLWLITFVDLVMLLLAFFVLMFSMSRIDNDRYGAVAQAYAAAFSKLGGTQDVFVGPQHLPAGERAPGDDLGYLETVLKTAFARDPDLASVQFRLTAQYLMIELPLAASGEEGWVLDSAIRQQVFEIGGVLTNLPNRIAVLVPAAGKGRVSWGEARTQGRLVRQALVSAGYPRPIAAWVRGPASETPTASSLAILVMPEAQP